MSPRAALSPRFSASTLPGWVSEMHSSFHPRASARGTMAATMSSVPSVQALAETTICSGPQLSS